MKNILRLVKPMLFVYIVFCYFNPLQAQEKGIITGGIQNPLINNEKSFSRTDINIPLTELDNKNLDLTPYIKYRKTLKREYVDFLLALTINTTNNHFKSTPNVYGVYYNDADEKKTKVAYFEAGKGLIFPIKKSFVTVGLNGQAGYDFGSSSKKVRRFASTQVPTYKEVQETNYTNDRLVILGLSTDCTYNQHLSKNFMITLEPRVSYTYQFNVTSPKQTFNKSIGDVPNPEITYEYKDWNRKFTQFQFSPTLGLTFKY